MAFFSWTGANCYYTDLEGIKAGLVTSLKFNDSKVWIREKISIFRKTISITNEVWVFKKKVLQTVVFLTYESLQAKAFWKLVAKAPSLCWHHWFGPQPEPETTTQQNSTSSTILCNNANNMQQKQWFDEETRVAKCPRLQTQILLTHLLPHTPESLLTASSHR